MCSWFFYKTEQCGRSRNISSTNRFNSPLRAEEKTEKIIEIIYYFHYILQFPQHFSHSIHFKFPLRLIYSWIQSRHSNMFVNSVCSFFLLFHPKKKKKNNVPVDLNSISFCAVAHICLLSSFPDLAEEIQCVGRIEWKSHSIHGQKWIKIRLLHWIVHV